MNENKKETSYVYFYICTSYESICKNKLTVEQTLIQRHFRKFEQVFNSLD